ncbi:MAG TPA: sugar phosphate isomerase/epimerase family protein [Phycisphaerae bacterium]|nr:sugar phosphate isomerase/epimerase family protein [Phycisphaerae bacterium]
MGKQAVIPVALAIDGLGEDARAAFGVAAEAGYGGVSFATNHAELTPDELGQSGRRDLKRILAGKHLEIAAIRIASPRTGLADPGTIDRTMENARKGMLLAQDLGVQTVALNVGNLADSKVPMETVVAAIRELAQHADAAGLTIAVGSETATILGGVLKRVDYERARVNFDTARIIGAGEDPLKIAESLAESIGQLTATDAVRAGQSVRATFLGEGQLPLVELMEILQDIGFRGPTVVDVRDLPDGGEGARHAAGVLRRLLGET